MQCCGICRLRCKVYLIFSFLIMLTMYTLFCHCSQGHSRTRDLDTEDLLEHLPALQQFLYRLLGCQVLSDSVYFLTIGGIHQ
jgi:hypothetical protein